MDHPAWQPPAPAARYEEREARPSTFGRTLVPDRQNVASVRFNPPIGRPAGNRPMPNTAGLWILANTKSTRAKLTADKLQALADLGLEWAAA